MSMFHLRRAALLILGAGSLVTAADAEPQAQRAGAPAKAVTTYGLENPKVLRGYQAVLAAIGLVPAASGDRAQSEAQIAYALDQACYSSHYTFYRTDGSPIRSCPAG